MDSSTTTLQLAQTSTIRQISNSTVSPLLSLTTNTTPYIKSETMFPVVLLFAILFIFFLACICDCRRDLREKRQIEEILSSKPPEVTVVDGNSGEEKTLTV